MNMQNQKELRKGYTTGTCAQAASKAAALMLTENRIINSIEVLLPCGKTLDISVDNQKISENYAICSVVKDSGDDNDITHGIKIFSRVKFTKNKDIVVLGGEGVGRVTKPGLAVKTGRPAINPVPERMIIRDLQEFKPRNRGFEVTISIPGGREIAKKTWNPDLGILDGLSIIGTTGIVEPKSKEAYKKSISLRINIASNQNRKTAFITPGYVGEKVFKEVFDISSSEIIKFGDHAGYCITECSKKDFREIILVGHIGKISKISAGIFNTHYRTGDARLETVAAWAAACGADQKTVNELLDLKLAEESVKILEKKGLTKAFDKIAERAVRRLEKMIDNRSCIRVYIAALDGKIVGKYPTSPENRIH